MALVAWQGQLSYDQQPGAQVSYQFPPSWNSPQWESMATPRLTSCSWPWPLTTNNFPKEINWKTFHHTTQRHKRFYTSTCWQIWISLAIWFSSSLFLFTRLVRLFSRVCCWEEDKKTGANIRDKYEYIAVSVLIDQPSHRWIDQHHLISSNDALKPPK